MVSFQLILLTIDAFCVVQNTLSRTLNSNARLKINYKSERAHRLSYHIFTSDVKAYEVVHHTCSNKSCINPKHLRLVSPQENTAEMLERRHYHKQIAELQQEVERLQKDRCKCQSQ